MFDRNPRTGLEGAKRIVPSLSRALALTAFGLGAAATAEASPLTATSDDGSIQLSMAPSGSGSARGSVLFEGERYAFQGRIEPAQGGFDLQGLVIVEGDRLPFFAQKRGLTMRVRGGDEVADLIVRDEGSWAAPRGAEHPPGGRRRSVGREPGAGRAARRERATQEGARGVSGDLMMVTEHAPGTEIPVARFPLPATWRFDPTAGPGQPVISGPGGVTVRRNGTAHFAFPRDPSVRAAFERSGQRVRPFPSVDQVLRQDILPAASQWGYDVKGTSSLPEVARSKERFMSALWKVEPTRDRFHTVGVDLLGRNGRRAFVLVDVFVQDSPSMQTWGYAVRTLEADASTFEAAKAALVHAESRKVYDSAYIAQYNANEQQKARASWNAHGRRMAGNQAAFEARNRAIIEGQRAVNEAIVGGWRSRSTAMAEGHRRTIDGIRGEEVRRDPATGQHHRVESGSDRYWSNRQGEYIGSDDAFYDPSQDPSLDGDWVELESE